MNPTSVPSVPKPTRRGSGTAMSALLTLAFKSLKLLKLAKVLVFGATLAGYGWLWGWRFGLIFTMSLVFHEWGHIRAAKLVGVEANGFWLIPFMGGVTYTKPAERWSQLALVSLGGPLFGLIAALFVAGVWMISGERNWAAYAAFIALINLIQLLPFGVLDGGRVILAVSASVHTTLGTGLYVLGLAVGAIAAAWLHSFVLTALLVVAALETVGKIRRGGFGDLPPMTGTETAVVFLGYIGLILVFIGMIAALAQVPGADLAAHILRD